ncbi:iron ABC transporter permease [Paenibacillus barcinonensis]|uniref:Iron ABC transporter permease n=1 Tax=Paenibacillus barcinonensis TaxID=198119 RepID=A0A2V4VM55_PAEBA|nr:iron ABC transporter permease [Paenibacillus barcinonensis]PYE47241.1 iron complex transport system permease protein [Paenibacillus barcinonensis]QKS58602.1 iron ABC transporter permease [Paenibacillus barcinonensis]
MRRMLTFRNKKDTVSMQVERKSMLVIFVCVLLFLIAGVVGTSLGSDFIAPWDVLRTILGLNAGEHDFVVLTLRLPRVLLSLLVGAALGMSGALLQGIIRNPLASPDVIGITGGAAVAAVGFVSLLGGAVSIKLLPLFAVIGALVTAFIIYVLAWKKGVTPIRLVLIGIGVSAITGAGTTFMLILSPFYTASQAYIWLTGSIYGATWTDIQTILPVIVIVVPVAIWLARSLNAQEFGDDLATGLGVKVQWHRSALLLCSVLLAGIAVSVAGTIGFVGLIAPHIARKLVGRMFGSLLLVSGFVGALLVCAADLIARTAFLPLDVPAGVFTAGIGAPFFLYLLFKNRNQY